jgi:hypothetical protein
VAGRGVRPPRCGRRGSLDVQAADHWGATNPWDKPFFIVTHRPEEQPEGDDFVFVDGFDQTLRLEHLGVRQSPLATFVDYRVLRS